jgi:hypothetical protein
MRLEKKFYKKEVSTVKSLSILFMLLSLLLLSGCTQHGETAKNSNLKAVDKSEREEPPTLEHNPYGGGPPPVQKTLDYTKPPTKEDLMRFIWTKDMELIVFSPTEVHYIPNGTSAFDPGRDMQISSYSISGDKITINHVQESGEIFPMHYILTWQDKNLALVPDDDLLNPEERTEKLQLFDLNELKQSEK